MFSFGATNPPANNLFGQQPSAQTQGSPFGQQPSAQAQGNLFGQPPLSNLGQQPSGSLFGQAQLSNQAGLFGQAQLSNQAGLFGQAQASQPQMGQPQTGFSTQNQMSQPQAPQFGSAAQTATGVPYPKDTQFMDLPQEVRNALQELDNQMRQHGELGQKLAQRRIEEALSRLERGREGAAWQVEALEAALQTAQGQLEQAKRATGQQWRVGDAASRLLSSARRLEPGLGHHQAQSHAQTQNAQVAGLNLAGTTLPGGRVIYERLAGGGEMPPLLEGFLAETVTRLQHRLDELSQLALTVQRQLEAAATLPSTTGASCTAGSVLPSLRQCLRQQHQALSALTNRLAPLHQRIEQQRDIYRQYLRRHRHDLRDPFNREQAEATLSRMIPPEPQTAPPSSTSTTAGLGGFVNLPTSTTTLPNLFGNAPPPAPAAPAGPPPSLNQPLFGVSLPSATTNLFRK